MASGQRHPNFLIVCDHGIPGDHSRCDHSTGCSEVDRVAWLPWFADRPGWWAAEGVDEAALRISLLEGKQRGWDPWRIVENPYPKPDDNDPRRFHIEIICTAPHCSRRAYRSDDDKLQTLLGTIAADDRFRACFTIEASESVIVMTLKQLAEARDAACTRLHLDI